MKTVLLAGALFIAGMLNAQETPDSTQVRQMEQKLQEMLDKTNRWAENMQKKLREAEESGDTLTEEEWEEMEERVERRSQSFEMRMGVWAEEMEEWAEGMEIFGEDYSNRMELKGEEFARLMGKWAEIFGRQMEEMAEDFEQRNE